MDWLAGQGIANLATEAAASYCAHQSSFCISVRAAEGVDRAEGRNDHRFAVGGQVVSLRHRNCQVGSTWEFRNDCLRTTRPQQPSTPDTTDRKSRANAPRINSAVAPAVMQTGLVNTLG